MDNTTKVIDLRKGLIHGTTVSGPMYSPDIPPDQRIGALFRIIKMRIKAELSPKRAREVFNTVVTIIAEPLGCVDIAQALVAMCSKSQINLIL